MTDNATLAKRIADLERQLSHFKHTSELLLEENKQLLVDLAFKNDLLESSMLSEATAKQYAEEVDKQNKALAAQVEALRLCLADLVDGGKIFFDQDYEPARNALKTTPQQHLAEIRAEAGRDGYIAACLSWMGLKNAEGMVFSDADKYADSIRQSEVK